MATTAAALQPLKPVASTSIDGTSPRDGSTSQTPVPASASQRGEPHGFGILQHTGPPVQDDIPGLYRDGRVRNPVPSKLKGKTDARKGNFGVMHIDLTTTNETHERDAAAKRTSEGTQLAAKLAQTDRYVPIKRSKFVYRPEDPAAPSSPRSTAPRHRTSPLTAAETKTEQTRLLTLLRSLHPVMVVDQLCKALAFFGGIPGAQASADGSFPDSAEANGSGALFVGWLAEIFPALGQGSVRNVQQAALKRPRGRPRGSKNTKAKKDKLVRKRLALGSRSTHSSNGRHLGDGMAEEAPVDDSWVDVDDAVAGNEEEGGEEGIGRETATPSNNNNRSMAGPSTSDAISGNGDTEVSGVTPTPKRRGRPKGSKNKPKDGANFNGISQKKTDAMGPNTATENVESAAPSTKKRKPGPGRPKGSKNRPKESVPAVNPDPHTKPTAQTTEKRRDVAGPEVPEVEPRPLSVVVPAPPREVQPPQSVPQDAVTTMSSQTVREPPEEPSVPKFNAGGSSKGVKRKRKASNEAKASKDPEAPSTTAPALDQSTPEAALAHSYRDVSLSQLIGFAGSSSKDGSITHQPAKRQKVSKELQQQSALINPTNQSNDNRPAIHVPAESQTSQSTPLSENYSGNPISADNSSSMQRARNQMSMPVNRSPLQQNINSQHASPDLQIGYGQSRGSLGGTAQPATPSRSISTGPYPMALSGRPSQGIYNQARHAQGHYGQQQQRQQQHQHRQNQEPQPQPQQLPRQHQQRHHQQPQQESRQAATSHARSNANQRHLINSSSGQMSPAAGHDPNSFTASTGDGGYHGLTALSQQPSFSTQGTVSAPSPDSSYGNSSSRSVPHQSHSPGFQRRQVLHVPNSGMSSFHDYSDSAFLDMAGLESASQASLAMGQTSYSLGGGAMQRPSPTVNPSYNSASHSSFDGGITESTLGERLYHPLRRQ